MVCTYKRYKTQLAVDEGEEVDHTMWKMRL